MCRKILIIWRKKSKIPIANKSLNYLYKTVLSYCLTRRKYVENKIAKVVKNKNGKIMLLSKCAVCNSRKAKVTKEQEARGLLSRLRLRSPSSQVPFLRPVLFSKYKRNETLNKWLLAGDKFMPKIHLKLPGFAYTFFGPFTKNKERIQKFKQTGD